MLRSNRIAQDCDEFPFDVGPHLGARRKLGMMIRVDLEAWTKVQPYTLIVIFWVNRSDETTCRS